MLRSSRRHKVGLQSTTKSSPVPDADETSTHILHSLTKIQFNTHNRKHHYPALFISSAVHPTCIPLAQSVLFIVHCPFPFPLLIGSVYVQLSTIGRPVPISSTASQRPGLIYITVSTITSHYRYHLNPPPHHPIIDDAVHPTCASALFIVHCSFPFPFSIGSAYVHTYSIPLSPCAPPFIVGL
jgi:hypothetical protein